MNKNDNYPRTNLSTLLFDDSLHFIVRTSLQASSPLNIDIVRSVERQARK